MIIEPASIHPVIFILLKPGCQVITGPFLVAQSIPDQGTNTVSVTWNTAGARTISVNYTDANGCTASTPAIFNVTVDPILLVGTIDPTLRTLCYNEDPGIITLSGYTTDIIRWEYSTNAGRTWTTIDNTTNTQIPFPNLNATYRVVVASGQCGMAYSPNSIISYVPPTIPTVTTVPSPAVICFGQSATLAASSGALDGPFMNGSFNQANPAGWCVNHCTTNFPAQADNQDINIWSETNGPKFFSGIIYDTRDNTKFAIVNGAVNSTLETPAFSLVGITIAQLTWWQSYNLLAGTTTSIEISLDGGLTYYPEDNLVTYTGPSSWGNPLGLTFTSIDLTQYLGQPNLMIRFSYTGVMGSSWAIEDVMINPPMPSPVVYQWTPTTGMTPTDGIGQTVTVSPPVTTTYTVSATLNGCVLGTSAPVTVTVNPLPVCSITGPAGPVCPSSVNSFSAPAGMTRYEWSIIGNGTITSGAQSQIVTVTAGTGCNSPFTLTLRITDSNGCINTCTQLVNVVDNTAPVITVPAC